MKRYWVSWWSGYYEDEGCSKPPFTIWISGQRDRGTDDDRDEVSICALLDAETLDEIEDVIKQHFPDYEMRFCEEESLDFTPNDRFPPPEDGIKTSLTGE